MEQACQAQLLRIFIGEADKLHHGSLCEAIVRKAREVGLAGATAWRGISSFGPTSHVRTSRVLDLSSDLPIIIEIVDDEPKIEAFLQTLTRMFDEAQCGGLVTVEPTRVLRYAHGSHSGSATHDSAVPR
jgi:hypothetical protein